MVEIDEIRVGWFQAASFGGTNIDPTAWEDKKNQGESRFPAQVRVVTRKICEPLEEDSFRPILHHYDGPKFRLELNIPEVFTTSFISCSSTSDFASYHISNMVGFGFNDGRLYPFWTFLLKPMLERGMVDGRRKTREGRAFWLCIYMSMGKGVLGVWLVIQYTLT